VAVLKQNPVMVQVVRAIQEVLSERVRDGGSKGRIWEEPPDDWPATEDEEAEAMQEGKMTEKKEKMAESAEPEDPTGLVQWTPFRSGSKSRTRSRASQPAKWL
jgi:hypothetical protein